MSFESAREEIRRVLLRMAAMRRALEREAFGDEAYHREVDHMDDLDRAARRAPAPEPGARKKLNRLWAWNKRMRGR